MTFLQLLLVLAVIAGVAAVAAGKVRGGLPAPASTLPEVELPADPMATEDVDTIRFSVGFRGYRMDEVDAVLDRLGLELGAREEELRELRHQLYGGGPETVVEPASGPEPQPAQPQPAEPDQP